MRFIATAAVLAATTTGLAAAEKNYILNWYPHAVNETVYGQLLGAQVGTMNTVSYFTSWCVRGYGEAIIDDKTAEEQAKAKLEECLVKYNRASINPLSDRWNSFPEDMQNILTERAANSRWPEFMLGRKTFARNCASDYVACLKDPKNAGQKTLKGGKGYNEMESCNDQMFSCSYERGPGGWNVLDGTFKFSAPEEQLSELSKKNVENWFKVTGIKP